MTLHEVAPGSRIGAYTVSGPLAEDGRARRFAATGDDGTEVAITVSRLAPEPAEVEVFRRELAAATRVRMPGIVPVLGGGLHDGLGFVVEARVAATPLVELLAAGPLGARAVDVLRPAAQALDTLHAHGQLHRNLTPGAVVVDGEGAGTLRLTGWERFFPEPVADTGGGEIGGRPVYRAPETLTGTVVSHRSDLFAFACVAFEAVTATPAYTVEALARGGTGAPLASARHPQLPAAADAVFLRALAPNSVERHPSAADLVDELQAAFGSAYRPPAGRALLRWVWISGAAALVAVLALVATVLAT